MAEQIAGLRRCRCCEDWRGIDAFAPGRVVCRRCVVTVQSAAMTRPRYRAIHITASGRALLDAERRAAVA